MLKQVQHEGKALPRETIDRFRHDFELLGEPPDRFAVAVSGGPDSLALLLLANAAFPGRVAAATVDHGLRPESAAEAEFVAGIAAARSIPHITLRAEWPEGRPATGIQESAREARYAALLHWCRETRIEALLTAHHADDQAETLLMRLDRGAGLPGLAGIRRSREREGIRILRPLLGWRAAELRALCRIAAIDPIDDPSNADPRHERSRVRRMLRDPAAPDPLKMAESADHLAEVEDAMNWLVSEAVRSRVTRDSKGTVIDAAGLPREIKRRMLARLLGESAGPLRGSRVDRAVEMLENGRFATLAGFRIRPGACWTVTVAPPRRGN